MTAVLLAEALAAIRALPNPRATSGEWRRRDWDDGRTAAVDAVAAVLADVTEMTEKEN